MLALPPPGSLTLTSPPPCPPRGGRRPPRHAPPAGPAGGGRPPPKHPAARRLGRIGRERRDRQGFGRADVRDEVRFDAAAIQVRGPIAPRKPSQYRRRSLSS